MYLRGKARPRRVGRLAPTDDSGIRMDAHGSLEERCAWMRAKQAAKRGNPGRKRKVKTAEAPLFERSLDDAA
jgi:hypothetical protein